MKKEDITIKSRQVASGKWYCVVKDCLNSGTHDGYNIVYNGQCDLEFFNTEREVLDKGKIERNEYIGKFSELDHFCSYNSISGDNKKELMNIILTMKLTTK